MNVSLLKRSTYDRFAQGESVFFKLGITSD